MESLSEVDRESTDLEEPELRGGRVYLRRRGLSAEERPVNSLETTLSDVGLSAHAVRPPKRGYMKGEWPSDGRDEVEWNRGL